MTKPTLRKDVLTQFYDTWRNVTWKTIEHNGEFYTHSFPSDKIKEIRKEF